MSELNERIVRRDIEEEMKTSYTTYAMSVIISRALPDVRDGLKPSQRRILYAMKELGLDPSKKHRKCAKIAGDTSGNYHPHGEQVIYPTLVRMAQTFSMRYPLVNGQGNFGSIDGDPPAAMRYTEAKMTHSAMFMMEDIDKNTVDFVPNYDETLREPSILPGKFPNLLCNGSTGIAVGMATNIPPHNVHDVANCLYALIEKPATTNRELIDLIQGPDFPTGGIIYGREGLLSAYTTGRGVIKIRSKTEITELKGNKSAIIVTEIPYQVNKTNLIENIVGLVQDKVITSISDIRDESDKDGLRLVIELKRDENAEVALNQLFKHTQMQVSYGMNMLALVENRPKLLDLKHMLLSYIKHRREIVIRKTKFELDKAEKRAHILEGLLIALDNIDEIIELIKSSKSTIDAKGKLIERFKLSDIQAQAILEMQLQRLTGLEREKIENEYQELLKLIQELKSILASEKKILAIVRQGVEEVVQKVGDARLTAIEEDVTDINIEDLIPEEDRVVMITHSGYIKTLPVDTYRQQHRGGKGVSGMTTAENDFVSSFFIANSHHYVLFFTTRGKVYWKKVYELPSGSRIAKGKAIVNLLELREGEKVNTCIPVENFDDDTYLVFVTKDGTIKKCQLSHFSRPRKDGIIALSIDQGDELIGVRLTKAGHEVLIATKQGQAVRFNEDEVRAMGRIARGVRAIKLKKNDDCVVGVVTFDGPADVLTVTENGYGKKTALEEYRLQGRSGSGVINIKITPKVGPVVGVMKVNADDDVMMITESSMVVRTPVKSIRSTGRNTQGVRAIKLKEGDRVSSIAQVVASKDADDMVDGLDAQDE